ncbi:GNAT family N-acetyltransferase [Janthinobacterium sp. SUN128]|uniref:GNAT family N-acetyltransferase n=1 Tax=Janthinobacterium sp. SUN128 TaxID=3014790 RepID=UPI00271447CC|nr:GNAT family N-acetyltransferase [Janthinobacterium sp. SUN128]MDO8031847.1 GNAT family N-acetyltransferase [Janthinobacterium sp. SUN128]
MSNDLSFHILTSYSEVSTHLPAVVAAADNNKHALGFFPKSVFTDFARRELLFVIATRDGQSDEYAGHLLFDVTFPKAHVRQIYVRNIYRGHGLGRLILDALKAQLTSLQYISIQARVAEDLQDANAFWEAQGFYPQRVSTGGQTKKRMIVVRAHELETPQLFQPSGISVTNPLGFENKLEDIRPLLLLDLNVLFDLGPRRTRHEQAIAVFRAERGQTCSLAISSEIDAELKRTAHKGKTDPMQALARALPRFPIPPVEYTDVLCPQLAKIVFPERATANSLTANDISDLRHLATSIFHGLHGLITSDSSILNCSAQLRKEFSIEVISPESFQNDTAERRPVESQPSTAEDTLTLLTAQPDDEPSIRAILNALDVTPAAMASQWAAFDGGGHPSQRVVVRAGTDVTGYLVLAKTLLKNTLIGSIAVSESSAAASDTARLLLNFVDEQNDFSAVNRIRLHSPSKQALVREIAAGYGYSRQLANNELQKVRIGDVITVKNWSIVRRKLIECCDITLPSSPVQFSHIDQQISVGRADGELALLSIFRLESLFSPGLFGLQGRKGVLVPVQPQYAEPLLNHSPQLSLLPRSRAQLSRQRHYIGGPATIRSFTRGDIIFFYESGRHSAQVVALARVAGAYQRDMNLIDHEDLAPSVLEEKLLTEIGKAKFKTIVIFENIIRFRRPVPMETLQKLKCGEPHQLLTAQRLSAEQVQGILQLGFNV